MLGSVSVRLLLLAGVGSVEGEGCGKANICSIMHDALASVAARETNSIDGLASLAHAIYVDPSMT